MSITLRVALIAVSLFMVIYALFKIRRAQLDIDDTVFWILFPALLLLISIFPGIAFFFANLLGIASPANFVFLFVIFFLFFKLFTVSVELSVQKHRLSHLVQSLALLEEEKKVEKEASKKEEIFP